MFYIAKINLEMQDKIGNKGIGKELYFNMSQKYEL